MKDEQKSSNDNNKEEDMRSLAQRFKYPPTPARSARVRAQLEAARPGPRVVWKPVVLAVFLIVLMLFSVPAVRAKLAEFFQVGVVRIFPNAATPTTTVGASPTTTVGASPTPGARVPDSLLNLAGRTTLEDAREESGFALRLPSYPSDLGLPDVVYHQAEADMVILVWLEPADPQKVRLSLHELGPNSFALKKMSPVVVQETTVNGEYALWTTGPYLLEILGKDYEVLRLINGHTLIWQTRTITHRLETSLPLQEAVRIAESLQ